MRSENVRRDILKHPCTHCVLAWCERGLPASQRQLLAQNHCTSPYATPILAGNRALGRLIKWVSALTAAVEALRDHNRDCPTRTLLTHTLALRDGRVEVATLNPLCSQWCRRCKSLTDRIVRLHATPTRQPRAECCEDCVVCLEPVVLFDSAPHVVLKDAWLDGGPGGNEAWLDQDQAGPLKLAVLLDSGPDQDTRLEYAVLLESGGSVAHAPMRDAGCWAGSESGSTESSAWVCTGTWRELICRS